jgi:hypothetical protein
MLAILIDNPTLEVHHIHLSQSEILELVEEITGQPQGRVADKPSALRKLGKTIASHYSETDAEALARSVINGKFREVYPTMTKTTPPKAKDLLARAEKILKTKALPVKAKIEKAPKEPKAPKEGGTRPRLSTVYAGKKLTAVHDENPRRTGTAGHKSMEIIRKHPGMTVDEFLNRGGRSNDLRWDIEKGNVKLS